MQSQARQLAQRTQELTARTTAVNEITNTLTEILRTTREQSAREANVNASESVPTVPTILENEGNENGDDEGQRQSEEDVVLPLRYSELDEEEHEHEYEDYQQDEEEEEDDEEDGIESLPDLVPFRNSSDGNGGSGEGEQRSLMPNTVNSENGEEMSYWNAATNTNSHGINNTTSGGDCNANSDEDTENEAVAVPLPPPQEQESEQVSSPTTRDSLLERIRR